MNKDKFYAGLFILIMAGLLVGLSLKFMVPQTTLLPDTTQYTEVKYLANLDPILNNSFDSKIKLIDQKYFAIPEQATATIQTEAYHGAGTINKNDNHTGYRVYGSVETYSDYNITKNTNDDYYLLQYKLYDNDEYLNQTVDTSLKNLFSNGFKTQKIGNIDINGAGKRIFILKNDDKNITHPDIIIIFNYDTIIGRIDVKLKDKTLTTDRSINILKIMLNEIDSKIKTKSMKLKISSNSHQGIT